jgi:hypothetical protein
MAVIAASDVPASAAATIVLERVMGPPVVEALSYGRQSLATGVGDSWRCDCTFVNDLRVALHRSGDPLRECHVWPTGLVCQ